MISMNKNILILTILLYGCVGIDYKLIANSAIKSLKGAEDIIIDDEYIDARQYSFVKVKIGRSSIATLGLYSIQDDLYEWIGADGVILKTKHGRVVEVYGLDKNMQILDTSSLTSFQDSINKSFLVKVDNPKAVISINSSSILSNDDLILNENYASVRVQEQFSSTSKLKWNGVNTYWYSKENGLPLKTKQFIHPHLKQIELEFYYIFR